MGVGRQCSPAHTGGFSTDARVEAARLGNDMLEQINPRIAAIHHEEPDGPTECISVMSQDFKSLSWEAIANVPTYGRGCSASTSARRTSTTVGPAGAPERRVRGRWTLKSPHHAIDLDALTAVYPDAPLVLLHRDPVVLCASVCSLISTLSGTFSDADHRAYIAEHWVDDAGGVDPAHRRVPRRAPRDPDRRRAVRRPRARPGRDRRARSTRCGDGSTTGARRRSRRTSPRNQGQFGAHGYDVAEYGLDAGELRERFAGYIERYHVRST